MNQIKSKTLRLRMATFTDKEKSQRCRQLTNKFITCHQVQQFGIPNLRFVQ